MTLLMDLTLTSRNEKKMQNLTVSDCVLDNLWKGSFAIIQGKCLV